MIPGPRRPADDVTSHGRDHHIDRHIAARSCLRCATACAATGCTEHQIPVTSPAVKEATK